MYTVILGAVVMANGCNVCLIRRDVGTVVTEGYSLMVLKRFSTSPTLSSRFYCMSRRHVTVSPHRRHRTRGVGGAQDAFGGG